MKTISEVTLGVSRSYGVSGELGVTGRVGGVISRWRHIRDLLRLTWLYFNFLHFTGQTGMLKVDRRRLCESGPR